MNAIPLTHIMFHPPQTMGQALQRLETMVLPQCLYPFAYMLSREPSLRLSIGSQWTLHCVRVDPRRVARETSFSTQPILGAAMNASGCNDRVS
jgi:hypothetical protein